MKKLLTALIFGILGTGIVSAQQDLKIMPSPGIYQPTSETQSYTYLIKDDGTARVWMRTEGIPMPKSGGEYNLTLPEKALAEVKAWYRENGCRDYRGDICTFYGNNVWNEATVKLDGKNLTVIVPKRTVADRDLSLPVSLGLSFPMEDVTTKKWWGRNVTIVTAKPSSNVNYLYVGVYLPDGIYARDSQEGPGGWGQALSDLSVTRNSGSSAEKLSFGAIAPAALDFVGGGEITRSRPNLTPGEEYSFSFMTATGQWKLYYKEIVGAILWMTGIAAVVAVILFMLLGKKPLWWYIVLTTLLFLLLVLLGGLWLTYRLNFGAGNSYTISRPALMDTQEVQSIGGESTPGVSGTDIAPDTAPVPPEVTK